MNRLFVPQDMSPPGTLSHHDSRILSGSRGFESSSLKNPLWSLALENPLWFERGPPYYVNDHPVLKYLGKKIANFLHDYYRDWFPGLGPPLPNGIINQLTPSPFYIKKLLRRSQKSQDTRQERPEICVFSRLEIGHKEYSGRQFVYCKPFKEFHDDLRMNYVFFVPPRFIQAESATLRST